MSIYRKVLQGLVFGSALLFLCSATASAQQATADVATADVATADVATADVATPAPQASTTPTAAAAPADETSDSQWHIYGTGYLWLAGVHGTVGVLGFDTSVHVSPLDLLSNFRFGIMGGVAANYNRWSVPVDFIWIRLRDDKAIPFAPNYAVQTKLTESIFTPKVAYLLVANPRFQVYGNAGLRYWHLGTTLSLTPSPLGNNFYQSANWVDFVAGGRITTPLSPKVSVTVLGDAGAGGASLDYQVAGVLNYQVKPKLDLQGAWRYMTVHYQGNDQFIFDATMSGLIIGVTYKFK